jgi:ribosomal protein S18 acetylase RimI-like enzyme
MSATPEIPVKIRDFKASDQAACHSLYIEGLVSGKNADNDTAMDIDAIEQAYMRPGSHCWVGEAEDGKVVAMIGVQHHDAGVGEIRRLRVHPDHRRRGIGQALVETAIKFCREQNYLKVCLDTFMEQGAAIQLFEKFGFRHNRTRRVGDKDMVDFYLDLYSGGPPSASAADHPGAT